MARIILRPELWERIEPLLPKATSPGSEGGRPPAPDRNVFEGILFVLKTGIAWEDLPEEFGCSGMTCWCRLRDGYAAGVWQRLQVVLLSELRAEDKIDGSRAVIDSRYVRARGGGEDTGPNPTDRGKLGSKHPVLVDGNGIPLAEQVTAANVPDTVELIPLVIAIPPIAGKPSGPGLGGPGLRQRAGAAHPALAGHPAAAGSAPDGTRQRAGRHALGRGTDDFLAAQLWSAAPSPRPP